jgi:phosphoglycerate dehydrogenase-like enzyme
MLQVAIVSSIPGLHTEVVRLLDTHHAHLRDRVVFSSQVAEDTAVVLAEPAQALALVDTPVAQGVQWVQSTWAGVNKLVEGCCRRDFVCTRVAGFGPQMAEYVFGHLLQHHLWVAKFRADQQEGRWDPDEFKRTRPDLTGQVVGVLGAGDIGENLARAAACFGMVPIGLCSSPASVEARRATSAFTTLTSELSHVLAVSDVIINTLPSTPDTRGLLTSERLRLCQPRAPVFINIGRGDVTTSDVLIDALAQRYLSRAILDVFETEPLPADHPLWKNDRVTITPHISAVSTPALVARVFVDNLIRFVAHDELKYVVDMRKGY